MNEKRTHATLNRLLRAGDPAAADPGLDAAQRALMRQRILDAGREGRRQAIGWLLPVATAMALLALALGLALRQPRPPLSATLAGAPSAAATSPASQQIQFTTDSGVLVVWTLLPKQTS